MNVLLSTLLRCAPAILVLLTTFAASNVTAAVPEARPIVLSDQLAPGAGSARFFGVLNTSAVLNDRGQVAFNALLYGSGTNYLNNVGMWLYDSNSSSRTLVARMGSRPPGLPVGIAFGPFNFEPPQLNNRGEISFTSPFASSSTQLGYGAWTTAGGSLRLLAADGYPLAGAPGTPTVSSGYSNVDLSDTGQTAFVTSFGTSSTQWVDTPGQPLRKVVTTGDILPCGVNCGLQVATVYPGTIDNTGRVLTNVQVLFGTDPHFGNWAETASGMKLVLTQDGFGSGLDIAS